MEFVQSSSTMDSVQRELEKKLQTQAEEWSKVLRIDVLVAPTTTNSIVYLTRPKTWKEYLHLLMVHWYLPKDSFALVHLELEGMKNKFGIEKLETALAFSKSKPDMFFALFYLQEEIKNERELFGWILLPFKWKQYHFQVLKPRRAKRKVRRRGYKDQGSRRLPHEQHEVKFDYSLTELQNKIELDREFPEKFLSRIDDEF